VVNLDVSKSVGTAEAPECRSVFSRLGLV